MVPPSHFLILDKVGDMSTVLTIPIYTPNICSKLYAAACMGQSVSAFRGEHMIPYGTWSSWASEYEELQEAIEISTCALVNFYEKILLGGLTSDISCGEYEDAESGMTEKERCFLARDRLNQIDAQNYKVNKRSLTAPPATQEDDEVEDVREFTRGHKDADALDEYN